MATLKHPLTGVELNEVEIKRPNLEFDEAVTAHVLRLQGRKIQTISAMLGTNQARVADVLKLKVHPKAANAALEVYRAA